MSIIGGWKAGGVRCVGSFVARVQPGLWFHAVQQRGSMESVASVSRSFLQTESLVIRLPLTSLQYS